MATQTRVPTGNVTLGWQVNTGSHFEAVDDPVGSPDDDTTYVFTTVSGQRDNFTFSAFTVPSGATINSVQVIGRLKYVGTASDFRLNIVNEGGTVSEDTDRSATSTYADYTRTLTTNPWTAAAWTVNEVNSEGSTANRLDKMEVRSIAPNTDVRCTQLYLLVDYTEEGGSQHVRVMSLCRGRRAQKRRRAA